MRQPPHKKKFFAGARKILEAKNTHPPPDGQGHNRRAKGGNKSPVFRQVYFFSPLAASAPGASAWHCHEVQLAPNGVGRTAWDVCLRLESTALYDTKRGQRAQEQHCAIAIVTGSFMSQKAKKTTSTSSFFSKLNK
jgi:hypothetical protein